MEAKTRKKGGKTKERKGASDGYGHLNLFTLKSGQSKNSTKFLISLRKDAEKQIAPLLVISHTGVFHWF